MAAKILSVGMINIVNTRKLIGSIFLPLFIYKYNDTPTSDRINTGIPYIALATSNIIDNEPIGLRYR
jgi:hypothetical protein